MSIRKIAAALLVLSASSLAQVFNSSQAQFVQLDITETNVEYHVSIDDAYPLHSLVLLMSDMLVPSHIMDMGPWGLVSVDLLAPIVIPIGVADVGGSAFFAIPKPSALPPYLEGMDLFLKTVSLAYTVTGNPPQYNLFSSFSMSDPFVLRAATPDEATTVNEQLPPLNPVDR